MRLRWQNLRVFRRIASSFAIVPVVVLFFIGLAFLGARAARGNKPLVVTTSNLTIAAAVTFELRENSVPALWKTQEGECFVRGITGSFETTQVDPIVCERVETAYRLEKAGVRE